MHLISRKHRIQKNQSLMKYLYLISLLVLFQSPKAQNTLSSPDSSISKRFIHFIPVSFSNKFSLNVTPVLKINSGDTVKTETIDAAGFDKNGVKRQKGGNPLTGPFYIDNALAGDILAITLTKVVLNRPSAFTTSGFVSRSLPKPIIKQLEKTRLVKWRLDMQDGFASPDSA